MPAIRLPTSIEYLMGSGADPSDSTQTRPPPYDAIAQSSPASGGSSGTIDPTNSSGYDASKSNKLESEEESALCKPKPLNLSRLERSLWELDHTDVLGRWTNGGNAMVGGRLIQYWRSYGDSSDPNRVDVGWSGRGSEPEFFITCRHGRKKWMERDRRGIAMEQCITKWLNHRVWNNCQCDCDVPSLAGGEPFTMKIWRVSDNSLWTHTPQSPPRLCAARPKDTLRDIRIHERGCAANCLGRIGRK